MLNLKTTAIGIALVIGSIIGAYADGYTHGVYKEKRKQQEVITNEYIKKTTADIERHNAVQAALDTIARSHSEEIAALEGSTDGIIASLNADNKRLRLRFKTTAVPNTGDSKQCIPSADGRAELNERDAERLISIARKGDLWIKSLQDTVRVLQEEKHKEATNGH